MSDTRPLPRAQHPATTPGKARRRPERQLGAAEIRALLRAERRERLVVACVAAWPQLDAEGVARQVEKLETFITAPAPITAPGTAEETQP